MRRWHQLRHLFRTWFRRTAVEAELEEEVSSWIDELSSRHRARGLDAAEARRAALLEFGGREQAKEEARAVRHGSQTDSLLLDVRYAWRALRRAPMFTIAALATLALGIGGTSAIFSAVKAVLIEPFPYRDADALMLIWSDLTDLGYPRAPLAGPELAEFAERTSSFSQLGGLWATTATLAGDGTPDQLRVATVTPDLFPVLGVQALYGRTIDARDFGVPVRSVLLSHALWTQRYGGDPSVVGRSVTINDRPAVIVGVMGQDFRFLFPRDGAVPEDLQAWIPGGNRPAAEPRGQQYLRVIARRKPGIGIRQAAEDVAAVGAGIVSAYPSNYTPGTRFFAASMKADATASVRPALLTVFGAVAVLLVMACVNVAGLLIVRAAGRVRETQVRLAIGASRSRLLRQACVEGAMLSIGGGLVGLGVAEAALRVLVAAAPRTVPRIAEATMDSGVLVFTAVIACLCGFLFSVMPHREILRTRVESLQLTSRVTSARGPRAIVAVQIALGVLLLICAGLLTKTFARLVRIDPGFSASDRLTFRVSAPTSRYQGLSALNDFHRRLSAELLALPGVTGVGAVSHLPYDNLPNWGTPYLRDDQSTDAQAGLADARTVSPGFFEAVAARLVAGRFHAESDPIAVPLPVVVDELTVARLGFADAPIDRTFRIDHTGTGRFVPVRIIGVVGHLRHRSILDPGREQIFLSSRMHHRSSVAYVVTSAPGSLVTAESVRHAMDAVDPKVPTFDLRPLESYLHQARAANRFTWLLSTFIGATALLLAAVGVYGVIAYGVARRAREFGVRLALGASQRQLVGQVLRESGLLVGAGAVVGLVAAALVSPLMGALLYETPPRDPMAYATALAILAAVALLASWLPARRAAGTSPVRSLGAE